MTTTTSVPAPVPSIGMPADAVTVLMLRHGQSEWNAVRRWQGDADSPLTDLGRSQARAAASLIGELPKRAASVWSSRLARAAETASIIANARSLPPARIDARLREAHAGEWEGMTPDEIEVGWPGYLDAHRRPPGFESTDEVVARASAALVDIATDPPNTSINGSVDSFVLVVSHSGLIRTLRRHLGAIDERIPNLGGSWFTVSPDSSFAEARAELVVGDLFDPTGIVVSGVDAPGEDPGEQPDHADDHRSRQS